MIGYNCHNKPLAKNGDYTFVEVKQGKRGSSEPKLVSKTIRTRFSENECHHITSLNDVSCEGCRHRRIAEDE